jgi:hypothetical protein
VSVVGSEATHEGHYRVFLMRRSTSLPPSPRALIWLKVLAQVDADEVHGYSRLEPPATGLLLYMGGQWSSPGGYDEKCSPVRPFTSHHHRLENDFP